MRLARLSVQVPSPGRLFVSTHMTNEATVSSLVCVPTNWPRQSFLDHLAALRDREAIKDPTTMMRLAGLDPSMHTNWQKGAQPTTASLDKLAPVLRVPANMLYISAGRLRPRDLDAPTDPNMMVLPREFEDLIELYRSSADADARRMIREQIGVAVRGLRAILTDSRPSSDSRQTKKPRAS